MKRRLTKKGKICLIIITLIILFILYWFRNPFVKELTIEAGTQITIKDLLVEENARKPEIITTIDKTIINKVGIHTIHVRGNNRNFEIKINVKDTVAPEVTVKEYHYFIGDEFDANNFIKEVNDCTFVTGKMTDNIDLSKNGKYNVNVTFIDEGNNTVSLKSKLIVEKDIEPPIINSPAQINVIKGEPILYKQQVQVVDNRDGEIKNFTVDNSNVNLDKLGTYSVIYKATDKKGNTSIKEVMVVVTSKETGEAKKEAYNYADDILSDLIKEDMNKQEKLKAIYDYVMNCYTYIAAHEGTIDDYYVDALNGFKTKKGDCYVVNAMARVLLERSGIETYGLVLKGIKMNHISFMANTGDGWYHYCAFKKQSGLKIYKWTDEQLLTHYKKADGVSSIPTGVYPQTPKN